ncbi:MAG: hypothetical protein OFPI_07120 [Osedax symbiont Rs2]|nr:MAG: hypothetical protein OFPI_07120 [Osedax symbiont Rs2]
MRIHFGLRKRWRVGSGLKRSRDIFASPLSSFNGISSTAVPLYKNKGRIIQTDEYSAKSYADKI